VWNNAANLRQFAASFDSLIKAAEQEGLKAEQELESAPLMRRDEVLAYIRQVIDCIPYLDAFLLRMEKRLEELGSSGSSIMVDPAGQRAIQREYFREVLSELGRYNALMSGLAKRHTRKP
jgi:hypothetical protein